MSRKGKAPERISGGFSAIPHRVLDSTAFKGAGHIAKSLLFDLMRQVNGSNNGHLQLSYEWLTKERGWKSRDTIKRAQLELVQRGLVLETRKGGLNKGAAQFALTWLPISNSNGLDFVGADYQPGAWAMMDKHLTQNNSSVPVAGTVLSRQSVQSSPSTVPMVGTEKAVFAPFTVPMVGNNVSIPLAGAEMPAGECLANLPAGSLGSSFTNIAHCLTCSACHVQARAFTLREAA